jgi:hypothetical protein
VLDDVERLMGEKEWKEHADRVRRINNIMVWFCRVFVALIALALIANVFGRDVLWASIDMVFIISHLYYLDKFKQWRDAAYE